MGQGSDASSPASSKPSATRSRPIPKAWRRSDESWSTSCGRRSTLVSSRRSRVRFRKRCKGFVADGEHRGSGVKRRILNLFTSWLMTSPDGGSGPAEEILLEAFRKVEKEILEVLEKSRPPRCRQGCDRPGPRRVFKRSDAQRRRQVLADIESVLDGRPTCTSGDERTQAA